MRAVPRPAVLLALPALLLAACVAPEDADERSARCTELAAGISQAGLAGSPTQQQAQQAALRLDSQMLQLRDPSIHDAAVSLHFHLHVLDTSLGRGDRAKTDQALQDTRTDTTNLAKACGMAPGDFGLR